MSTKDEGFLIALEEARKGAAEGGIPVGSAIVSASGEVLGRGRNMRVQSGSAILHGETAAFESAKSLPYSAFKDSTLYTTLSPCPMCAGAALVFNCKKVVIGENRNMSGREEHLRSHGVEVVVLDSEECVELMRTFIAEKRDIWTRDFGDV